MTMTVQQERKKRRKRNSLTPEREDALAKEMAKALGVNVRVKRPSKSLEAALEALALDFDKLQPKVDKVFEIGRAEGYPDKEIGSMIRQRMKEGYSAMSIWRVFENYPEARQKQNRKKVNKTLTSDGKCPKCGKPLKGPEPEANTNSADPITDKNRFYKETIETKNKLIAELREEIAGLRQQLAEVKK